MIHVGGGAIHRPARPDIEGLRAIAVTMVLILHAGLPLKGGFVGVDIFFVISGFLMTSILLKELLEKNSISLPNFYARRARRLLPAATTVLLFTGVATLLFVPKIRWVDIGKDILASGTYVQNWRLANVATDYNAQGLAKSPLQHFWSLAVEEQFYFVWPVLILGTTIWARRRRFRDRSTHQTRVLTVSLCVALAILAIPSFFWSVHLTAINPAAAYFVTTTRLWELAVGGGAAIVALYVPRILSTGLAAVLGWVGLVVVIASAFVISDTTPFPGWMALLPTLGTAVVISAGAVPAGFGPVLILGIRPMQWVGKLSYSLYLWHWPLLVIVAARAGDLSAWQGSVVVGLSIIPAYMSFRIIEDPLRRSPRIRRSAGPGLRLGLACSVAGLVVAAVVVGATWPPPAPPGPIVIGLDTNDSSSSAQNQPRIGALVLADPAKGDPAGAPVDHVKSITPNPLEALHDDEGAACIQRFADTQPTPCTLGAADSATTVALVGDSHAAQWVSPLENIARQRDWKLVVYSKQNCTFAPSIVVSYNQQPYPQCQTWSQQVENSLIASPPDMIILSDVFDPITHGGEVISHDASFQPLEGAFVDTWRPLIRAGSKLVVLKDTPRPDVDIPACVSENLNQLTKCSVPRDQALRQGTPLEAAAKALQGVTFIDLEDAICPTRRCAAVIGGVLVYRDSNHLTATYAATLAPRLNAELPDIG